MACVDKFAIYRYAFFNLGVGHASTLYNGESVVRYC